METEEHNLKKEPVLLGDNVDLHGQLIDNEYIINLFNKRFLLVNNECYSLPEVSTIVEDFLWRVDELQRLKTELNIVKNYLNDYNLKKWRKHTQNRNGAKNVVMHVRNNIQPELLTQAWCKFYEIVSSFPLVPIDLIRNNNKCFKSVHLCEAPGAFIASLNHWLKTNIPEIQWDWIGMTLNPYYEGNSLSSMVDDDRFIRYTLNHWCFGEDNTGNLMKVKNLNQLIKMAQPHRDIFLITADGSIDCTDVPEEQENVLIHLHFCETIAALQLLASGGSFLLKIFTSFECNTICLIYLLCCCFTNVNVIKPATSKGGNSETYVVCTNFKGKTFILPYLQKLKEYYEYEPNKAIFKKQDIPNAFITKIIECSEFFKAQQCEVIEDNIITFHCENPKMLNDMKQIQCIVADKYIRDCNLKKLESGTIVRDAHIFAVSANFGETFRTQTGSYNERCARQRLSLLDQIKSLCGDSCNVELHVTSDDVIEYKFIKLPEDLQIRSGKLFHKICCSKFCTRRFLKIQNDVSNILFKMDCKIQFPSIQTINGLVTETHQKPRHEIVVFHYTDTYNSHKIITDIYDALQELDSGTTLLLIGYSLLTHLSTGLLYLIGCAFNFVRIKVCNDVGLKITLGHYNYNLKLLKFLNEIKAASVEAQKQGKAIFQIISPAVLYEGYLMCYSSEDFNHWIIKTYVHYVYHTLKKNTESKK